MNDTPSKKTGKRGGQIGNRNALRHGLRGGKVPPGAEYVEKFVNALRRQVEDQVLALRGEVTLTDAAHINSVLKWERHGKLAEFWLRKEADNLTVSDRLRFSEAIAKASDNRDKAIRALKLERNVVNDAWAAIDEGGE